jgi:hypothetical protein
VTINNVLIRRMLDSDFIAALCSVLVILFFLSGIINHSLPFAGIAKDSHSELWHAFNTLLSLTGIFAVISARRLGWEWLMTLFLYQIVLEARGALIAAHGPFFAEELFETCLNILGISCVWISRRRYKVKGL